MAKSSILYFLVSLVEKCHLVSAVHRVCHAPRSKVAFWNVVICLSVCPVGMLAACSLATAGHQRCLDCRPVSGRCRSAAILDETAIGRGHIISPPLGRYLVHVGNDYTTSSGSWSDFITWTTLKIHDWLIEPSIISALADIKTHHWIKLQNY